MLVLGRLDGVLGIEGMRSAYERRGAGRLCEERTEHPTPAHAEQRRCPYNAAICGSIAKTWRLPVKQAVHEAAPILFYDLKVSAAQLGLCGRYNCL